MKYLLSAIIFFMMWFVFSSCKEANNNIVEPTNVPPPHDEVYSNIADTGSIEAIMYNLDKYIPTWKQLERFTKDAKRLPIPNYITRALAGPVDWGADINIQKTINYFDEVHDFYNDDFSGVSYQLLPPYVDGEGSYAKELIFPISGDILDKKLRAATTAYLREKSLNRPNSFVNFYPPSQETPLFMSESEFLKWIDEDFIPEKIAEAKAAELMKAEYFIAWPLEFELFIKSLGGMYADGFLSNYSNEQILAFAQVVKNKIRDAVKENFHGKLIAHSYWNYCAQDSLWDRFDYKGFDEIYFAFFPQMSVEYTAYYTETQLRHYTKVIKNSGSIPWLASEITVYKKHFPGKDMSKIEKEIYKTMFDKLEKASIPPMGLAVGVGEIETVEARDYVKNYFMGK